jgi:antitoxin component of MazEF toxin-antitoxin module
MLLPIVSCRHRDSAGEGWGEGFILTFGQECAYAVITMAQKILKLVKIGNSRGVRLPKELLESLPATDAFSWIVENGVVSFKPVERPGVPPFDQWARLIDEALAEHGDDGDDFRDLDVTLADGLEQL